MACGMRGSWGAIAAVAMLCAAATCAGQTGQVESIEELSTRLDAQAAEVRELRGRLEQQESLYARPSTPTEPACGATADVRRLPVVVEESHEPTCAAVTAPDFHLMRFYADYDRGFVIRPVNPDKHPFELKVNGWIQFRHHGFDRDVDSWTDNAGVTRPVLNRNAFDIERGRLIFSGYAGDKRLTYFLQLDGDTDGAHTVDFFDYWWAWEHSDRFHLQMGKRKVSASRQWLLTARRTRFVDRPMANDFFRPDRTVGVWGVGRIGETGYYEAMVGNGYNTANIPNSGTDNHFTYAATSYFDPLGDFGGQIVDYDFTCDPLVRLGHSFVYAPQAGILNGVPLDEADFLRMTDGTRLTETGALAPDVTVREFDIYLYGLDAAFKWRGWSADAEVFLRWIEDIQADGAIPVHGLLQRGFYVEGGRFLMAEKLDANVRYSQVSGLFGDASEYAAGLNWYPGDTANVKVSFDVTVLDGSPVNNTTSDILVGDNGTLFRTQFQAEF